MLEKTEIYSFTNNLADNIRLDKFLSQKLTFLAISREKVKEIIKKTGVLVNRKKIATPKFLLILEDLVEISIPKKEETKLVATKIPLDIVFEDDDLIVLNKQSNLTVHPGAGNDKETLVNALLDYIPNNLSDIGGKERLGIVHRLDKNTTGLMLIAKNNKTHLHLKEQLQSRSLTRNYKALIWGILSPADGIIEQNIIRSSQNRKLMTTSMINGREAITYYYTDEVFFKGLLSLVTCSLKTGRTHQIRVHLDYKGNSVFGDNDYGKHKQKLTKFFDAEKHKTLFDFKRQALHAFQIKFIHPTTNKEMFFEQEIPKDFAEIIDNLRD